MQSSKTWINAFRRAYQRYDRFMEKQGFPIVLTVCVLVILLSALYTFHFREQQAEVQLHPADESIETGGNQHAQTLAQAQQLVTSQNVAAVLPSEAPFVFRQPVEGFLLRDYDMINPQYFAKPNYWRVHPGIDLQAEYGEPVAACADGVVASVWQDNELGLCVRISHQYGYESVYAGLSDASYVQKGDPVRVGQTIGHAGSGVLAEQDAEPHLHFEAWKGNTAVDPVELFLGVEPNGKAE